MQATILASEAQNLAAERVRCAALLTADPELTVTVAELDRRLRVIDTARELFIGLRHAKDEVAEESIARTPHSPARPAAAPV